MKLNAAAKAAILIIIAGLISAVAYFLIITKINEEIEDTESKIVLAQSKINEYKEKYEEQKSNFAKYKLLYNAAGVAQEKFWNELTLDETLRTYWGTLVNDFNAFAKDDKNIEEYKKEHEFYDSKNAKDGKAIIRPEFIEQEVKTSDIQTLKLGLVVTATKTPGYSLRQSTLLYQLEQAANKGDASMEIADPLRALLDRLDIGWQELDIREGGDDSEEEEDTIQVQINVYNEKYELPPDGATDDRTTRQIYEETYGDGKTNIGVDSNDAANNVYDQKSNAPLRAYYFDQARNLLAVENAEIGEISIDFKFKATSEDALRFADYINQNSEKATSITINPGVSSDQRSDTNKEVLTFNAKLSLLVIKYYDLPFKPDDEIGAREYFMESIINGD